MSLVWHIVRKDLRRMAGPAAGWLAFLGLASVWVHRVSWVGENRDLNVVTRWMSTTESLIGVAGVVGLGLLVVLAGVLGLEDRVSGTTSFWGTRPISGGALLQAKLLAAGLLFVGAPLVVLTPVWWVCGFSGGEMLQAACTLAVWHGALVLTALTLAALCAELGQMVFAALIWLVLVFGVTVYWPGLTWAGGAEAGWRQGRWFLGIALPWIGAIIALIAQYRTRRTHPAWRVLVGGLVLAGLVQVPWRGADGAVPQGSISSGAREREGMQLRASVPLAERGLPASVLLEVAGGAPAGEMLAPLAGQGVLRWPGGATAVVRLGRAEPWSDAAAMRCVGAPAKAGPVRWAMAVHYGEKPAEQNRTGTAVFTGQLRFGRMKAEQLYQVPLRDEARAVAGSTQARIIGWARGGQTKLLLEEHDAWLPPMLPLPPTAGGRRDGFVLTDVARQRVQILRERRLGAPGLYGLRVSWSVLEVSGAPPDERESRRENEAEATGAVLVRVQFEELEAFDHEIVALPLAGLGEGSKP